MPITKRKSQTRLALEVKKKRREMQTRQQNDETNNTNNLSECSAQQVSVSNEHTDHDQQQIVNNVVVYHRVRKELSKECMRKKRASETIHQTVVRRELDKQRAHQARMLETQQQSTIRRESNKQRVQQARTNEVMEQGMIRRLADSRRKCKKRNTESCQQMAARRENNRLYKNRERMQQTCQQMAAKRKNDRLYISRKRKKQTLKGVKERRKQDRDRKRRSIRQKWRKCQSDDGSTRDYTSLETPEQTDEAIMKFKTAMLSGPSYVCTVCHRQMYVTSVKRIQKYSAMEKFSKLSVDVAKQLFEDQIVESMGGLYMCLTCYSALKSGRIPAQAKINGLKLDDVPPELQDITPLERQLISTRIPFMKIVNLPRGQQRALHGPVVNVPAKFDKVCSLLPRIPESAGLIRVKLKRQLKYQGHCMYQYVRPNVVRKTLNWLKANNRLYRDIAQNDEWEDVWNEEEPELWQAMTSERVEVTESSLAADPTGSDDGEASVSSVGGCPEENGSDSGCNVIEAESSEILVEDQAALDRDTGLRGLPLDSCFHINNIEGHTVDIAPSEGELPVPIFMDSIFEEGCNPDKYPYGTGGFGASRPIKLTAKKYFSQRILDVDGRFVRDPQYLHIAQYAVESKYVYDQIRIALRKAKNHNDGKLITAGMLKSNEHLKELFQTNQAFKFMSNVRGSPAYWQRVFYDVLAMVRQLGCPTWFMSLSAADLHWPELITLIANERGRQLSEEDVKNLSWEEKCDILRQNPVTAARQFNYRLDKFFSLFLKSSSHPLGKVTESFIRIEFQARGSPHAHLLLWIEDAPKIDEQTDEEVCEFIDRYVTCDANPEDEEVRKEVFVQQHRHSSGCRRGKEKVCRFNYPQLPSCETLVRRPPEDAELIISWMKCRGTVVKKIQAELEKCQKENKSCSMEELLEACDIPLDYYRKVVKMILTGSGIIMKRKITDVWTNNYNSDVLRAWRGNMDIQYITDAYACIMYVVSYACKAENSMSDMMKTVVKESDKDDLRTQMKKVAATFLNHQEISAQEAAYRLLSLYLKKMSRKVVYVDSNMKENRVRMSKPYSEIELKDENDTDLFLTSIHEKYSSRPANLESMCLAEFAKSYRSLCQTSSVVNVDPLSNFKMSAVSSANDKSLLYCDHIDTTRRRRRTSISTASCCCIYRGETRTESY